MHGGGQGSAASSSPWRTGQAERRAARWHMRHALQVPGKTQFQRALAGGFAGALAKTLVAPLERLRTIVMASPQPVSLRRAAALAWADGGALGLFRGNSATILKAVPGTATKFAAYDHIRDCVIACRVFGPVDPANPRGNWAVHIVAGGLAGLLEGSVTHPLETVRTIMQMPDSKAKTFLQARYLCARGLGTRRLCCPALAVGAQRKRRAASGLHCAGTRARSSTLSGGMCHAGCP
jgi:hypothetical protein